jgi:hypothetical protein
MIGVYALAAIALMAAGMTLGFVAAICLGIRRHEKAHRLAIQNRDPVAEFARKVCGFCIRIPS